LSERTSLLEWFYSRRESMVSKDMRGHAQDVGDTIFEFNRAMSALCQGDKEKALDALKRSFLAEKAADAREQALSEELSRGDLEEKNREDLLHLVRRMDYAADWCKEAGMNLQLVLELGIPVPSAIWAKFCIMTKELEGMAKGLKVCVDNLGSNNDLVLKTRKVIEDSEHTMDELYFTMKKEFFMSNLDARAIYLMRDLLHGIENSADNFKDSADIIHILIVSQRDRPR
jgi:predicted phosphate transport protein (TIGR00153 family)